MPRQIFQPAEFLRELQGFYSSVSSSHERTDRYHRMHVVISSPHIKFDTLGAPKVVDCPQIIKITLDIQDEDGFATIHDVNPEGPLEVLLDKYGYKP